MYGLMVHAHFSSESWHPRDSAVRADGEEDAIFAKPAHTKEALPGPDGLDEGSQENRCK
jgi:hypothetical protein